MIRQQAFIGSERMLKGGLHCHTTRSDGKLSPEEVIRLHKRHGYDFLAITDHRCYNYMDYAPDAGLTIIPGMEYDNGHAMAGEAGLRCFHSVCLGPVEGNGFRQDERIPSSAAADQFAFQKDLDDIHRKGNLTFYCHPEWSATPAWLFDRMEGHFAMEVWNSGCAIHNDMDRDAPCWDELLGQGKRIYGVAVDDGHHPEDHCHGWVMVRAENNVSAILEALKEGRFYSSCGPEIHDFYVNDGKAVIECSPAAKIRLHSDCHETAIRRSADTNLTHAEFDISRHWRGGYRYVRISVADCFGNLAWTNPIFLD